MIDIINGVILGAGMGCQNIIYDFVWLSYLTVIIVWCYRQAY